MLQYLEYLQYRLKDLLHFRPRAYFRLFELYNADLFPAQFAAIGVGIAILALLFWRDRRRGRVIAAILAACWLWVAWGFVFQRLASIHLAGPLFAAAFALEAVLLIAVGVVAGRLDIAVDPLPSAYVGIGVFLVALFVQPLIGPFFGRPWAGAELFGLMPDPTVAGTLGLLLLARNAAAWLLLPIPLLWCIVQGTTLVLLKSPDALVLPALALVVLIVAVERRIRR